MARLSNQDDAILSSKIIADHKTGKYSQRELSIKHNVSVGKINKIVKGIPHQNEHLVDAQVSLLTAKAYLTDAEMNSIVNTAHEVVFNQGLITNATQLNLVRMTQALKINKKLEKISVGDGMQKFEEVELGSGDYKNIQDAIDKAGQTLGVIPRGSGAQVAVQSTKEDGETMGIQIYIPSNGRE